MKQIALLLALIAPAVALDYPAYKIGPPVCHQGDTNCSEFVGRRQTQGGDDFDVLTIGPGGRICGPAIVRGFKEGDPLLDIGPGVCIPALDGSK